MEKEAIKKIQGLVQRFRENLDVYKKTSYNETQLRREYVDPLFEALGWDVANRAGYAEQYKDVVHEDTIKIGVSSKAPDYSFRIGGQRKFFLETKKPSVNIKDDTSPAYQLRRYAWSAKLPLSILTDFEELAIYDCRIKPNPKDGVATGRIAYYTFEQYIEKFGEIYDTFSKEAVLKGSFDRYIEQTKGKKGTAEVDKEFLKEIESWREALAKNLAMRNPGLSVDELNFSVQHTIDRVIFLRICEDRGIEDYGQLQALLNGADAYKRLFELFYRADEKYNSGLFDFKADKLTHALDIDDKVLKEMIESLYYPKSPYEFSVLGAEILGNVYEQFLGKVIRLTSGHQAKVEEKPEVKKAGGVYYTPDYIVKYIVENTVGKLLDSKTPLGMTLRDCFVAPRLATTVIASASFPVIASAAKQSHSLTPKDVSRLRILDPACGSGSFLIGAYGYLLDEHIKWYRENTPEKHAKGKRPAIYRGAGGEWRLTTSEKKRILLNNIFGVDIDRQAVEVTKLSLLLKVLEGENEETLGKTLALFHERALPNLDSNIKCGNSLIGPDFYDQPSFDFGDEELKKINPFDWNDPEKGFGRIMEEGGFDVVIGNPPYGYMIPNIQQEYFLKNYRHQDYQKDLYLLFLERYEYLLKFGGLLGVIVSNTWLQSVTLRKIREYLTTHYRWHRILHLPEKVFKAVIDTHVLIFEKVNFKSVGTGYLSVDIRRNNKISPWHKLPLKKIPKDGTPVNIVATSESQKIFNKIRDNSRPLKNIFTVYNGVKPFEKGKGTPPQTEQTMRDKPFVKEGKAPDKKWLPLLRGSLIQRYQNLWNKDYWISYGPWLAAPRDPEIFGAPLKIMVRQTGDSIIATMIEGGFIARDNLHVVLPEDTAHNLRYILGIINSRLIDFIYTLMNPEKGEALAQVKKYHVEQLPIRTIDFKNPKEKSLHDKMVSLVDRMLGLNKKLRKVKTPHDRELIERHLKATDNRIDKLVYELYGLTEEEIKVVEGR
ncbi:MAG: N-6 DNA methylase [Deltaproteobacteria bacterium]|nr:N-6 DNA methylase [Deltaproteobacteria bacterium]